MSRKKPAAEPGPSNMRCLDLVKQLADERYELGPIDRIDLAAALQELIELRVARAIELPPTQQPQEAAA